MPSENAVRAAKQAIEVRARRDGLEVDFSTMKEVSSRAGVWQYDVHCCRGTRPATMSVLVSEGWMLGEKVLQADTLVQFM